MKRPAFLLCLFVFSCFGLFAQTPLAKQEDGLLFPAEDSVRFAYNEQYFLTPDSCASIIRAGRYDFQNRRFKGRFLDVSKRNASQVVASGAYDENGQKEGDFVCYYLNGNLQAKGRFKGGKFTGKWEAFYPGGQPAISFVAEDNGIKVLQAWREDGRKLVENGYGNFEALIGAIVWKGKLVGGQPDGKWIAQRTHHTDEVLAWEQFALGEFRKGHNQAGDYKDSSRILLVSADELLPLSKAEGFWRAVPCNAVPQKIIVNARYAKGAGAFAEEIKNHLVPVLDKLKPCPYPEPLELKGNVMTDGRVVFESTDQLTSALKSGLIGLPPLEPAWANGRKVEQEMVIVVNCNSSVYSFSYRFLPLK